MKRLDPDNRRDAGAPRRGHLLMGRSVLRCGVIRFLEVLDAAQAGSVEGCGHGVRELIQYGP